MAADPYTDETATQRFARSASASERLREVNFPMVVRGYHRPTVDLFIAELLELVEDLESHQTREGVVQKALGELGEETAGILQRAHETADDITARSRAQADARLARAEREAEILRRDADEYSEQVVVDTRALWEERQRLIEDIRQLADEVLGTADDAIERLKLPEQIESSELPEGDLEEAVDPEAAVDPETMALPPEPFAEDPEPTEPFRLGAVADEPEEAPPEEEHGHTVELEALPGGSEDPPQREHD
jgi:cell division septum initiation protein DivIVA